jgi:exopolysaccharide biosynthesis polyprenyl glycosylphosphotransferase
MSASVEEGSTGVLAPAEDETIRESIRVFGQIADVLDERTLDILARRRRSSIKHRGRLVGRVLLLTDVLALCLAFALAELPFLGDSVAPDQVGLYAEGLLFLSTLPIWIATAKVYGLYSHDVQRADHSTVDDFVGVFHVVTIGAWVIFAGGTLSGIVDPNLLKIALFWLLAIVLITLGRALARAFCRTRIAYLQNAIIVGAGEVGQLVGRKLLHHPEYGINVVGFVDSAPKERRSDLQHLTLLGPPDRLPSLVRLFDVERVVIAFSNDSHDQLLDVARTASELGIQVDIVPRLFELIPPGVATHTIEGVPLVALPPMRLSLSARFVKRAMDILLASMGLVVLAPLFAVIALRIKLDSRGPVFFRQVRRGRGGETFRIYKFRTMVNDAEERKQEIAHLNIHAKNGGEARMFKAPDDPRVTGCGKWLRRYSLDELPQLINVVSGEMSLVGPRPLILDEDQHVTTWARKRLQLRPGITGLWQVLGRSDIPFEEMTKFDYLYVATWSLGRDLRLIGRTIPQLMRSRSAY